MSLRTRLGRLEGFLPRGAPREPREVVLARLHARLDTMRERIHAHLREQGVDPEAWRPPGDLEELRRRILERVRGGISR